MANIVGALAFRRKIFFRWVAWKRFVYSLKGRQSMVTLRSLRGAYGGKRCFIMGNGPSLLKCDLNKLKGELTIVSNANFLIWDKLEFRPTFLTVEDPLVAEDRSKELRALKGIHKVFPFDLKKFLGPQDASDTDAIFVNFLRDYKNFPQFSNDLSDCAYWGGTVSFFNIQLAAYLGAKEIVLIGFDHSYAVPKSINPNKVITSDEEDVNHIHPDYFGPGYRWHDPNVARMEIGYMKAREILGARGVTVLNATVGGHLEVFPRVSYESFF